GIVVEHREVQLGAGIVKLDVEPWRRRIVAIVLVPIPARARGLDETFPGDFARIGREALPRPRTAEELLGFAADLGRPCGIGRGQALAREHVVAPGAVGQRKRARKTGGSDSGSSSEMSSVLLGMPSVQ